jgi:hypothetical protein
MGRGRKEEADEPVIQLSGSTLSERKYKVVKSSCGRSMHDMVKKEPKYLA